MKIYSLYLIFNSHIIDYGIEGKTSLVGTFDSMNKLKSYLIKQYLQDNPNETRAPDLKELLGDEYNQYYYKIRTTNLNSPKYIKPLPIAEWWYLE